MKKILSILFTITLISTFAFVFSSCNSSVSFNVNFMVDGEVYNTVSTEGKETITIPENPTKEGYTFDGWYWDNETWQTPFTANSLLDAPLSSDMSVYAKWNQNVHVHTPVTDAGVLQTDTEDGLTEGSHCSECGEVIVAQQVIPANLQGTDMKSTLLTVGDETLMASFPNNTETFSFLKDIVVAKNAEYIVARDIFCESVISSKTVPLELGDNTYYILITNGSQQKLYTVTIRRLPMYTVTFNSNGGTSVVSQTVEEGSLATEPTTSRIGYTFSSWSYDFTKPIMGDTKINATWTANTNTPYKVEYYLENLTKDGYDLVYTDSLTGTTASYVTAEIKDYEHFTYNAYISESSGNIAANGSLVLKVCYKRNSYTANGRTYPYGTEITITATVNLGYTFNGWYINDELVSENYTYTCVIEAPIVAKFEVVTEMENFNFSSSETTCTITGVKDNTVTEIIIPDYVTSIGDYAFYDCSSLVYTEYDNAYYLGNDTNPYIILVKAKSTSITSCNIHDDTKFIHSSVFSGCSSLVYTEYDNAYYLGNDTNPYIILVKAKSTSITSCNIHDDTKFIHSFAFSGCYSLTNVTIPNSVTNIGYGAFYGCSSLTNITIPNSVTSIGDYAFYDCSSLVYIEYDNAYYLGNATNPYILLVKAKDIHVITSCNINEDTKFIHSSAFSGCYSLTSITIPNSVTSIGDHAFYNCSKLTNVTIPNSVTSIGWYAFYNCDNLTSITIPNSVTSIGDDAFSYCDSLTSVTFENTTGWTAGSTSISSSELADKSTAAEYLRSTYHRYTWTRSE